MTECAQALFSMLEIGHYYYSAMHLVKKIAFSDVFTTVFYIDQILRLKVIVEGNMELI